MFSGCEIAGTYNNKNKYMPGAGTRLSFVSVVELSKRRSCPMKTTVMKRLQVCIYIIHILSKLSIYIHIYFTYMH